MQAVPVGVLGKHPLARGHVEVGLVVVDEVHPRGGPVERERGMHRLPAGRDHDVGSRPLAQVPEHGASIGANQSTMSCLITDVRRGPKYPSWSTSQTLQMCPRRSSRERI